jgi:cytochrome bd-type quinol oxidase subunit 2
LSLFGRHIGDYPKHIHVIPFLYYILYTFLIRNAILDLAKAREDERKRRFVDNAYIVGSLAVYAVSYLLRK